MAGEFLIRGEHPSGSSRPGDVFAGDDVKHLYGGDFEDYLEGPPVTVLPGARGRGRQVSLDLDDDDVLEIRLPDGSVDFQRGRSLARYADARTRDVTDLVTRATAGRGGVHGPDVRTIRATVPRHVAEAIERLDDQLAGVVDREPMYRSPAAQGLGVVLSFAVDPAARATARAVAGWIESPVADDAPAEQRRRKPKRPGLYRVTDALELEAGQRLDGPPDAAPGEPWLLLVHGTFSHTEAAFGRLRRTPEWRRLQDHYAGRVLALEHPTLSRSPAENLLDVAALLPADTALDVVSHSRGGLLGDLMALLTSGQDLDLAPFAAAAHPDVDTLPALRHLLTERQVRVGRYARVASPSRGTTLASRRLDRWASILLNAFNLIPGFRETGVPALVRKFLLTLLENRTDPRVMPGIEAMMPGSPCIALLNTVAQPLPAGLGCIAGDHEGENAFQRVWVAGVDLFYGGDNDLVVDTSSMTEGPRRTDPRVARFTGPKVNHSAYFERDDSRQALAGWLTSSDGDVPGFAAPGAEPPSRRWWQVGPASRGAAPAPMASRTRVVLVPDAFGCTIEDDGEVLWPDVATLARTGVRAVLGDATRGRPGRLLAGYDDLRAELGRVGPVHEVRWDARKPLRDAAGAVEAAIAASWAETDDDGSPVTCVHVVAHGAGALAVLLAVRDGSGELVPLWDRIRNAGGRCLLLSPPLQGSWETQARLAGKDELSVMLALLDPTATTQTLGEVWRRCAALVEQSADAPDGVGWRLLADRPEPWWHGVTAVYGTGTTTPGDADDPKGHRLAAADGDGYVAVPDPPTSGLECRYAGVGAWELLHDPVVLEAIGDLLDGGAPDALLSAPPNAPVRRGPDADSGPAALWRPPLAQLLFPTRGDLERAALHGTSAPTAAPPQLRVGVLHDDLAAVDDPILIGVYDGTPIAGADAVLDTKLGGALTRRLALGQYAGAPDSLAVFSDAGGRPQAVVIGLGDVGDLTPGRLGAGVTEAVLRLAAEHLDRAGDRSPTDLRVASLLIGTSAPDSLPVHTSVTAIVNGVRRANRRLRDIGEPCIVEALTFVELFEERALEAVHALERLGDGVGGPESVLIERTLKPGVHGRRGPGARRFQGEEWRTVRIVGVKDDDPQRSDRRTALQFTTLGHGARASQDVTVAQRRLVDELVRSAIDEPYVDKQLYNTLYELLLPPALKWQGRERGNLLFVVDPVAASLPLELLATRTYDDGIVPVAVETGVIRKLESPVVEPGVRRATGTAALVIGNPPTPYPPLPGAAEEARRVAQVLRAGGFDVRELIWDEPARPRDASDQTSDRASDEALAVLNALFAAEYRVIHIAGHGVHVPDQPEASGVVIGVGEDREDLYLSALELAQLQVVPELVFLNCCHLAAVDQPRPLHSRALGEGWRPDRLAASVSRTLIESGVKAVVAAGWAVDDRAAWTFAEHFYRHILAGHELGRAAHEARSRTYDAVGGGINTWGAYQIYGPPAYRLNRHTTPTVYPPASRSEYRDRLHDLQVRAGRAPEAECDTLRAELTALLAEADDGWKRGRESALAAEVWALLGDYRSAQQAYETAVQRWEARADLRTIEQHANITAKAAVQAVLDRPAGAGPIDVAPRFDVAERRLTQLMELVGATPERLSLLGSCLRRRAQVEALQGGDARSALAESAVAYEGALQLFRERKGRYDFYSGIQVAVAQWLVDVRRDPAAGGGDARLRDIVRESELAARRVRHPDFWSRVAAGDAALAAGLVTGDLGCDDAAAATRVAQIVADYRSAFAKGSSRSNRLSISEHLQIIETLIPPDRAEGRRVREIRERLFP